MPDPAAEEAGAAASPTFAAPLVPADGAPQEAAVKAPPHHLRLEVLHISLGALWGTLLRFGLTLGASCYNWSGLAHGGAGCASLGDGVVFTTLAANLVGCFTMGLFSSAAALGLPGRQVPLAAFPAHTRVQRLARVHVAQRTGLCGALTSWASWNTIMVVLTSDGEYVRAWWGYLIGTLCAAAALSAGGHAAAASRAYWKDHPVYTPPETVTLNERGIVAEDYVGLCAAAATVLLCALGVAYADQPSLRAACAAALLGPPAVLLRWALAKRFNPVSPDETAWLPRGTLCANTAACLFDAALTAYAARAPSDGGRAWIVSVAVSGVGGGLSTVSSVAAEVSGLMASGVRARGYAYMGATLALGYLPALGLFSGTRHGAA